MSEETKPTMAATTVHTFTQAQVDSIVAERLGRERRRYRELEGISRRLDELAGALGVSTPQEVLQLLGGSLGGCLGERELTHRAADGEVPLSQQASAQPSERILTASAVEENPYPNRTNLNGLRATASGTEAQRAAGEYNLTPRQMAFARSSGMSYRRYAELLAEYCDFRQRQK